MHNTRNEVIISYDNVTKEVKICFYADDRLTDIAYTKAGITREWSDRIENWLYRGIKP